MKTTQTVVGSRGVVGACFRAALMVLLPFLTAGSVIASEIVIRKAQGDVEVRRGVAEGWMTAKAGTAVGMETTLRTGPRSGAVVAVGERLIQIPAQVMVDLSDIRELTQEELMLKLTMQQVRESPYRGSGGPQRIPNAAVVHGSDASSVAGLAENDPAVGELLLNGTRMLFDNGFYPTCALRTMEVIRRYPALNTFDAGWLAAESLERSGLRGEARKAYAGLSSLAQTDDQRSRLQHRLESLRDPR